MNQKSRKKITKDMTIAEVLENYPETAGVLHKNLGFCTTCPSVSVETLALGAHLHEVDINKLVKDLNQAAEKVSKEKK